MMNRYPLNFIIGLLLAFCSVFAQNRKIVLSDDLEVQKISDQVWIHISYHDLQNYQHVAANGMVYVHHTKAFIIDTPWTDDLTQMLIDWLSDSMSVSVEGVIVTHWHKDCMGGLAIAHEYGIPSYAYRLTAEIAKEKDLPIPQNVFEGSLSIPFADDRIICYFFGAGHARDNIVVWIPKVKMLFGGCLVKALSWNGLGNLSDADLNAWPITLKHLLKTFPECGMVIPGHGDFGDMGLVRHTLNLF